MHNNNSSNNNNNNNNKRRQYPSYARLYGWFLSLASVIVLTCLQLRAQLLLTRQITEQSPVTNNHVAGVDKLPSRLYDPLPRKRHLLLGTREAFRVASSSLHVPDDDSSLHVHHVRVQMHSISYAASCLQSLLSTAMIETQAEDENVVDYAMISILLDTTTSTTINNDDTNLKLLMQRLRQRYPDAQLFINRRRSNHKTTQEEDHSPSTTPRDTLAGASAEDTIQQEHEGHSQGSWGAGDACYWFQDDTQRNETPAWLEFNPRAVQAVSSQPSSFWLSSFFFLRNRRLENAENGHAHQDLLLYAYYYYNDAKQTLTIHNPFDTERMLYLTYKIGPDEALTRIILDGVPTVVIEPYREQLNSNERMSWETSPVGKVGPRQAMRVQWEALVSPWAEDDGTFRLLGVAFGVHSK